MSVPCQSVEDANTQCILLSLHGQIGDFGMARDLINESVYVASGGRVPVKWTALEVST